MSQPRLWQGTQDPYLYRAVLTLRSKGGAVLDRVTEPLGLRTLAFDPDKGFFLNGQHTLIKGVCLHQDAGALGAAVPREAFSRRLKAFKELGCNAIRTSHNPPAPELLDLCDPMGFVVMDEAFDTWRGTKTPNDYGRIFPQWHEQDMRALIRRDRNHPSVFIWSIGNEINEQWNSNPEAGRIGKELSDIVRNLDKTRPITSACNFVSDKNKLITDGGLDLVGTNYQHNKIPEFQKMFPGRPIIGTETTSALATNGAISRGFPARLAPLTTTSAASPRRTPDGARSLICGGAE